MFECTYLSTGTSATSPLATSTLSALISLNTGNVNAVVAQPTSW